MSTSIIFNREEALSAGFTIEKISNGTEEQAIVQEQVDPDFAAWLRSKTEVILLPNKGTKATNVGFYEGKELEVSVHSAGSLRSEIVKALVNNNIKFIEV